MIKTDTNEIYNGLCENKNNDDWIADNIKSGDNLLLAAKSLSAYGNYLQKESKENNIEYINTEFDFQEKIKDITRKLEIC